MSRVAGIFKAARLNPVSKMIFRFALPNTVVSAAAAIVAAICLGLLARTTFKEFVIGALDDERLAIAPETLAAAAALYPDSARILARSARTEMNGGANDLRQAEENAAAAIENSPFDYRNRLLLAAIEERRGATGKAAQTFNDALRLAPNYSEVHWRIANLRIRTNEYDDALEHFQRAVAANPSLAYPAIDLIWNLTNGADVSALKSIVRNDPREQISLARFLIRRGRVADAFDILSAIDGKTALGYWETSPLINELIEKNYARTARRLWINFRVPPDSPEQNRLVWNGDFESANLDNFNQFEWQLKHNNFVRISIDDRESRSGANSLLLDFLGRGATRLDSEIKQRVAVRAGTVYRLEFFVKTEDFRAPESPRVAVSDESGKWIVYAAPIAGGSEDWRRVTLIFTAPKNSATGETALFITVKREPKSAAEEATRGRIWFDDFSLTERGEK